MPPSETPPDGDHPASTGIGRFESSSFKKRLSGGGGASSFSPPPMLHHTSPPPSPKDPTAQPPRVLLPRRYEQHNRYSSKGIFIAALVCMCGVALTWVFITDIGPRNVTVTPAMLLAVVTGSIVFTQVFLSSRGGPVLAPPAAHQSATPTVEQQQQQQPQIKLFGGAPAVSAMAHRGFMFIGIIYAPLTFYRIFLPAIHGTNWSEVSDQSKDESLISYPDPRENTQHNPLSPPKPNRSGFASTPYRVPSPYGGGDTSVSSISVAASTPVRPTAGAWASNRVGSLSIGGGGTPVADVFGHEVVSAWTRTVASEVIDKQIIEPLIRMLSISDSQLSNAVKVAGQGFFLACATVSDGGWTVTRPPATASSASMGYGGDATAPLPGAIYLSDRNLPHPLSSLPELNAAWKHRLVLERYYLLPPIQEASDASSSASGYGGGALLYQSRDYVVSRVCDWATHGLRSTYQFDLKEVRNSNNSSGGGYGSDANVTSLPSTTTCDTVTDSRILDHILLHALDCHMNNGGGGGIGGGGGSRPFTGTFVRSIDAQDAASMDRGSQASSSTSAHRPSRWSTGGLGLGRRGADSPVWIERCYDTTTGLVTYNVVDSTRSTSQGRTSGASHQYRDGGGRAGGGGGLMLCQKGNANIVQALAVFLWALKKASPEHFSTLPTAFKNATETFPPPNPPSYATTSSSYPSLPQYFNRRSI